MKSDRGEEATASRSNPSAGVGDPWTAFRDVLVEGWLLQKQLAHRHGLSVAQYMLLRNIASRGAAQPSELAEEFGVSPPAMTLLLGGLEDRGWVHRTRGAVDRRRVEVTLAPKARKVLATIESRRSRVMRAAMVAISPDRRAQLAGTLELIRGRLRAQRVRLQRRGAPRGAA